MAEDELRRALAYPRYQPPRAAGLPPAARSAVRLSRPLLAPLLPPVSAAARMSGSLLASWWPTARTAASAARQTPLGRTAEPVLWRALRVRRVVGPLLPGPGRAAPDPAEVALDRIRQVAGTLVSAGVISEAGAREVLQSLVDALALRGRLGASQMYWPPGRRSAWGPRFPWPAAGPAHPLPAGSVQAVSIGAPLPLGPGGGLGTGSLLALAMGPGRAVITARAHLVRPGPRPRPPGPRAVRGDHRHGRARRALSRRRQRPPGSGALVRHLRPAPGTAARDQVAGHHRARQHPPGPGRAGPLRGTLRPPGPRTRPDPRPACRSGCTRPTRSWTASRRAGWPGPHTAEPSADHIWRA